MQKKTDALRECLFLFQLLFSFTYGKHEWSPNLGRFMYATASHE
jgi:hypothetical protein